MLQAPEAALHRAVQFGRTAQGLKGRHVRNILISISILPSLNDIFILLYISECKEDRSSDGRAGS